MDQRKEAFLKELLTTFKLEAEEHLQAITSGLLELERTQLAEKRAELVETVFREAHNLKGAARIVNVGEIERICQAVESVFAAWKRHDIAPSPALFDVLHEAVDMLGKLLGSVGVERTPGGTPGITGLVRRLEGATTGDGSPATLLAFHRSRFAVPPPEGDQPSEDATTGDEPPAAPPRFDPGRFAVPPPEGDQPPVEKPTLADTVRISTAKLSSLLLQAEELISVKLVTGQYIVELHQIDALVAMWKDKVARIHPDLQGIQRSLERYCDGNRPDHGELARLREFLEWNEDYARELEDRLVTLTKAVEQAHRTLSRMVDDLLGGMKQALLLPFSSLLTIVPKLVRDLSRDRGKEVELIVQGDDIEIDRHILEEMKDPLIHILRNCIDHGIEKPEVRERKGKPVRAMVTVIIAQRNSRDVEMRISDDGSGIDVANVKAAAVKLGVLSGEEAQRLDQATALSLIFHSGLSTSPVITDISGRGLGLAIVQEKVERLGGAIAIESQLDVGTTFRITLPVTRSTFRGVIVRVAQHLFVLPTVNTERVLHVTKEVIKTVENRDTIELNRHVIPLVRLGDVLELSGQNVGGLSSDKMPAIVIVSAHKQIAFLVDEVLNEQEVLVKSLGPQLSRVRNIDAATVLGNGRVVPILNVPDLMKSALRTRGDTGSVDRIAPTHREGAKRKSILVAEDSIITRTLVKNMLEAAGYEVKTAVDGVDALSQLHTEEFDLVVSDVEMPRMNGFELTTQIRSDQKHAELPVVLVTGLQSREDRERGIAVGASAYIVKSSLNQSNLVEVIRRLI